MDPARLLHQLIALPSVNPAFAPAGDPNAGEHRVAGYFADLATRAGLQVQWQSVLPGRRNLIVRLPPRGKVRGRVLLVPHLDTVGAGPDQLRPQLRQGCLHGRGACDTKGSAAAMFCAVLAAAASANRPAETEIVFAGVVDEENEQRGSRRLASSGLRADLAIVGEPTRLRVVTAHKGDVWLRVETRGRAAHGATPQLGRNAVYAMAKVVDLLETEYAAGLRHRTHPLLGHGTVNVGAIAGGCQANIVPDRCHILVDRRTLPGETAGGVVRELRSLFRRHHLRAWVFDQKGAPCLPLETDPALAPVQALMQLAGQRKPEGVHYFCDAAVLAGGGTPSVVFGPGDIAQAHTADEWLALDELTAATEILTRFLRNLP